MGEELTACAEASAWPRFSVPRCFATPTGYVCTPWPMCWPTQPPKDSWYGWTAPRSRSAVRGARRARGAPRVRVHEAHAEHDQDNRCLRRRRSADAGRRDASTAHVRQDRAVYRGDRHADGVQYPQVRFPVDSDAPTLISAGSESHPDPQPTRNWHPLYGHRHRQRRPPPRETHQHHCLTRLAALANRTEHIGHFAQACLTPGVRDRAGSCRPGSTAHHSAPRIAAACVRVHADPRRRPGNPSNGIAHGGRRRCTPLR